MSTPRLPSSCSPLNRQTKISVSGSPYRPTPDSSRPRRVHHDGWQVEPRVNILSSRRLRETVAASWEEECTVVLAGLANSYTHYITTWQEYQTQRFVVWPLILFNCFWNLFKSSATPFFRPFFTDQKQDVHDPYPGMKLPRQSMVHTRCSHINNSILELSRWQISKTILYNLSSSKGPSGW